MLTRKKITKVMHGGHTFTEVDQFPDGGKLPTGKDVVQRVLYKKNPYTHATAYEVAQELIELWIWTNVYTINRVTVADKMYQLMDDFSYLNRFPKGKKRDGPSYQAKIQKFVLQTDKLFDIFCEDPAQRRALEVQYQLRMTDEDYLFYNDQKNLRLGRCIKYVEKLSSSDISFQRKTQLQLDHIPSTSTTASLPSDTESQSSIDTSSEEYSLHKKNSKITKKLPAKQAVTGTSFAHLRQISTVRPSWCCSRYQCVERPWSCH